MKTYEQTEAYKKLKAAVEKANKNYAATGVWTSNPDLMVTAVGKSEFRHAKAEYECVNSRPKRNASVCGCGKFEIRWV